MALKDFFLGTPAQSQQLPNFSPEQLSALQQILSTGLQGLQGSYQGSKNPYQGFEPIANQARESFQQQTIPSIAERFGAMTGGALSSPALYSQLGQAGAGLETGLAALQSQYGQQNIANEMQNRNQLMQLLGIGLQPTFQNYISPGQPGFLQSIFPALGRLGTQAIGGAIGGGLSGGPLGALTGGLGGLASGFTGSNYQPQQQGY